MDVGFVLEHQLTGQGSQAVEGPWYLFFFHFLEEFQVSSDSVAQTHTWGCVEFGYAAEYHQVLEFSGKANGGNFIDIRGKLYVSFVDHHENVLLIAEGNNFTQVVYLNCR